MSPIDIEIQDIHRDKHKIFYSVLTREHRFHPSNKDSRDTPRVSANSDRHRNWPDKQTTAKKRENGIDKVQILWNHNNLEDISTIFFGTMLAREILSTKSNQFQSIVHQWMTLDFARTPMRRTRIRADWGITPMKNFRETKDRKMSQGHRILPHPYHRRFFIDSCSIKFNSNGMTMSSEKIRTIEESFTPFFAKWRRLGIDQLRDQLLLEWGHLRWR